MSNSYEKLDAFLEKAFEGSPNTPEACELKIEITTNLRQQYDDLISNGMSEDEAFRQTCDSLGDTSELFGRKEEKSSPGAGDERPASGSTAFPGQSGRNTFMSGRTPFHQLVITFGILFCALCWVPTVMLSVNGYDGGWIAAPILVFVAAGVFLFIFSSAMRYGATAKTYFHYGLIGLGVGCEIACAVPVMVVSEPERLGITLLFALVAAGIILIISGAMIPAQRRAVYFDYNTTNAYTKAEVKPIKKLIWLITVIVYFALSFITHAWAVTWIVFLIGSAFESLILSIMNLRK